MPLRLPAAPHFGSSEMSVHLPLGDARMLMVHGEMKLAGKLSAARRLEYRSDAHTTVAVCVPVD
jgi:hypothetical protein